MQFSAPLCISSRLMPGVKINDVTVSIETPIGDKVRYYIDGPDIEYTAKDLRLSPMIFSRYDTHESDHLFLCEIFKTLLDFLYAAGESYQYHIMRNHRTYDDCANDGENVAMFPEEISMWTYMNSSEIEQLIIELDAEGWEPEED